MLRILIANHTPAYGSGSGTYSLSLATGLVGRGHDVALLTPPGGPPTAMAGVRQFVAQELTGDFPSFTGHPHSSRLYNQLSSGDLHSLTGVWQRSIAAVLRRWPAAIVHTQHLWVLTSAALNLQQTVVATCHGSELPYLDGEQADRRRFRNGSSPAAVVSVSRFIQRSASRHLAPDTPHMTLLNPYDPTRFGYRPRSETRTRPRIGFSGRLVEYKRVDRFLHLTRLLADHIPNIEAWIIGDGPERPTLEHLARSLGLAGQARFLGFQPLESMAAVYRSLDALILCSTLEPFGLAALEAAACGTPVFVPDEGGLSEFATEPHIRVFSWSQLASAITEVSILLAHGEAESQRLQRSRYVGVKHSLDAYLSQLEDVYFRTIEGRL